MCAYACGRFGVCAPSLLSCRTICLKTMADAYLTRGSTITSDLEMSVRHFAKFGPLATWPQLLVQKPNPGLYSAGKGGNSSLFKDEQSFTASKRKAIGLLAEEFPAHIKLLDKATGKSGWKHFEFVKQPDSKELVVEKARQPNPVCENCVCLEEKLQRVELKLKNAEHIVQLMIERDRVRIDADARSVAEVRTPHQ